MVNLLVDAGWHVVATDLPSGKRSQIMTKESLFQGDKAKDAVKSDDVEYIEADLTDKESLVPLFKDKKYQAIFHTASLYDYFAPLDLLTRVNVEGLKNLLEVYDEFCSKEYPKFVHWSTCGVYGEPKYERWDIPADETAPLHPHNNYNISKVGQEMLLKEWREKKGIPVTILRPAPIYGPAQTYGMFHIFNLLNKVGFVPLSSVYPRIRRLRMPMVHVEDLVRIALFVAEAPPKEVVGEAFNAVADCGFQDDFLEYLGRLLNIDVLRMPLPAFLSTLVSKFLFKLALSRTESLRKKGKRPKFDAPMAEYMVEQLYFSNEKLKRLGFKFKYPDVLSGGIKQTVDWYLENGWLEGEKLESGCTKQTSTKG
jgi:nucleoside-diphosphate-sugar epimerase